MKKMKVMNFEELSEFKKDIKRLGKKYKTIAGDLEVLKKVIGTHPQERPPFSYSMKGYQTNVELIKVKKIASRSFKGKGVNSGLRLIYANLEESETVVLIEMYHKSEKESEERERIQRFISH